jgi:type III restriction enzyme
MKIGDITQWLKEKLEGYEVVERFEDESIFARLNEDEDINILMGSRAFYEGWDSNRPNVIAFINIGKGEEAKKFVLQSIGRGVRIEPFKNVRRRLEILYGNSQIDGKTYRASKGLGYSSRKLICVWHKGKQFGNHTGHTENATGRGGKHWRPF